VPALSLGIGFETGINEAPKPKGDMKLGFTKARLHHTVSEFTKQAVAFAQAPQIRDEEALRLVCLLAQAGITETVLDVACGPGILTCALAEQVRADAFNRMERLRNPSHVRALRLEEMVGLFGAAGLRTPACASYRLEFERESLLSGSFPAEGTEQILRKMFVESLTNDFMGLDLGVQNDTIWCSYPISVFVSRK